MVALLMVFLVGTALADTFVAGEAVVQLDGININHAPHNLTLAAFSGETIPVKVLFNVTDEAKNVKVKVDISSGNEDYSTSYVLGDVINDSRIYRTGIMSLKVPSRLSEKTEDVYVTVTISGSGFEPYVKSYVLKLQRNSYELRVLSVDHDSEATAGSTIPVMVVVRNVGFNNAEDSYITVSVPELGISAKAYLDKLSATTDDCDANCCDNGKVSVSKILNLKIPADAKKGTYDLIVTVYNEDTKTVERRVLKIDSASSQSSLIATSRNQEIKASETKTYELSIVNADNSIKVYTLSAVAPSALEVSVPTIVTVAPQTSETVKVTVKAKNNAEEGSYTFGVVVNGEQTPFVANVVKSNISSIGIAVLTIFLAIIFVALLVLLLVLLFRREKKVEEVETSYY